MTPRQRRLREHQAWEDRLAGLILALLGLGTLVSGFLSGLH